MARILLVVLPSRDGSSLEDRLESLVLSLERSGRAVDVKIVDPETAPEGLAAEVLQCWSESSSEVLVALDGDRPYLVEDVIRVVARVESDPDRIALASRFGAQGRLDGPADHQPRLLIRLAGRLQRLLTGSRDPAGGLVAISRRAFERESPLLAPIGRQITLECLLKCRGRTVDVPVASSPWPTLRRPHLDDLRQSKRLLNYRFGDWSRLVQFCAVGASGMVVDLTIFALLSDHLLSETGLAGRAVSIFGRPLELIWVVSAAIAIALALTWNFTLNRRFTFSDRRTGSIGAQFATYVLSNALAVTSSFLIRLALPLHLAFFSEHRLVAAVVGIVAATGISFTLARAVVFRSAPSPAQAEPTRTPPVRVR